MRCGSGKPLELHLLASSSFDPIKIGPYDEEFVDGATGATPQLYSYVTLQVSSAAHDTEIEFQSIDKLIHRVNRCVSEIFYHTGEIRDLLL